MLISCGRCGLKNLPDAPLCAFCRRMLPEDAESEKKRGAWGGLAPALRRDLETASAEGLRDLRRWREKLDEKRTVHAVCGSLLYGTLMSILFLVWWRETSLQGLGLFVGIHYGVGAAAGWLINRFGGGQILGPVIFVGAFLLSLFIGMSTGRMLLNMSEPIWVFTRQALLYGVIVAFGSGFGFGRYLAFDRYTG